MLCEFLFKVQQKNRLAQKGVLKRFSIECYGKQDTYQLIRGHKKSKFEQLRYDRNNKEWEQYFLRYIPEENENRALKKKKEKINKKKTKRKKKKKKGTTLKNKIKKLIEFI